MGTVIGVTLAILAALGIAYLVYRSSKSGKGLPYYEKTVAAEASKVAEAGKEALDSAKNKL